MKKGIRERNDEISNTEFKKKIKYRKKTKKETGKRNENYF